MMNNTHIARYIAIFINGKTACSYSISATCIPLNVWMFPHASIFSNKTVLARYQELIITTIPTIHRIIYFDHSFVHSSLSLSIIL